MMRCEPINEKPFDEVAAPGQENLASRYALANLVRYTRRGSQAVELSGALEGSEIFFIGETTEPPAAAGPTAGLAASDRPPAADVFYIGPE